MTVPILIALLAALSLACAARGADAAPTTRYAAEKDPSAITLKTPDGKPIVRYVIGKLPAAEEQTSAPAVGYLHPIHTPSGQVITRSKSGGHGWLRGAFVAWPQAQALQGPTRAGFWTCGQAVWKEKGLIENRDAAATADEHGASLTATNAWSDGQNPLLTETARIRARSSAGMYLIEVRIELAAAAGPVKLLPWAFTGFTVHGRQVAGESVAVHDPTGPVKRPGSPWNDPKGNWPDAAWYDLVLTGRDGTSIGLAVIGHPGNPKTTWNMNPSLRFMSASVTATEPTLVEPGKPLVLRYCLAAHDGPPPAEQLGKLAEKFRGSE